MAMFVNPTPVVSRRLGEAKAIPESLPTIGAPQAFKRAHLLFSSATANPRLAYVVVVLPEESHAVGRDAAPEERL